MDALALNHKVNILYREDELENRIVLLHRWTSNNEVDITGFTKLLKMCTPEEVESDNKRKSGGR